MPLPASERRLRAQLAAHTSWANTTDRTRRTAPGRAAAMERFYDEVDPERALPPDERERRANSARKAYFAGLALKSAQARRRKAAANRREAA